MTAPRRSAFSSGVAGLGQSLLAGQVPTSWTLENVGSRGGRAVGHDLCRHLGRAGAHVHRGRRDRARHRPRLAEHPGRQRPALATGIRDRLRALKRLVPHPPPPRPMTRRALLTVLACLPAIAAGCGNTTHHAPARRDVSRPNPHRPQPANGCRAVRRRVCPVSRRGRHCGGAARRHTSRPRARRTGRIDPRPPAPRHARSRPAPPSPGARRQLLRGRPRPTPIPSTPRSRSPEQHGRWVVVALTPPDFVQALAPAGPAAAPAPRASAAAQIAARRVPSGLSVRGSTDTRLCPLSGTPRPGLLAELQGHPPRIPPAMRSLHATVAAIAMQPHGSGWQALANVTDARESYELILTLTPHPRPLADQQPQQPAMSQSRPTHRRP